MALADCFSPLDIVREIFKANPNLRPPIPVEEIAKASGISQISECEKLSITPVLGFMVSDEGKQQGIIKVALTPSLGRKRFTIGHELGHFLIPSHSSHSLDFKNGSPVDKNVEAEADEFSSELLLPLHLLQPIFNNQKPTISKAIEVANTFEMSVQATINRLISSNLWPHAVAVFLDENKKIQYIKALNDQHYDSFLYRRGNSCSEKLKQVPLRGETITRDAPVDQWFNSEANLEGTIKEEIYCYHDSDYMILVLRLVTS